MITKFFLALGVRTINSPTFAKGYYYEYSLVDGTGGEHYVTRRLCNRYEFSNSEQETVVDTDSHVLECKQALMYNFPHAFNADGSVAIDLSETLDKDAEQDAPAETETENEAEAQDHDAQEPDVV